MSDIDAGETTLRMERIIAAPPDVLFALWVDPAQLIKWWAPDGFSAAVDTLETRPGGRWRVGLRGPGGAGPSMSGVYRIVDPPRRLAFSWAWDGEGGVRGHESEVTVNFEAVPGGTRLVLLHEGFDTSNARDRHNNGWLAAINNLSALASSVTGGVDDGL
jgi:uncharacterized protein YndB with AHSA1/START domain